MTTPRETDPNTVTDRVRDEKLLAAIGKYTQEILRAGSTPTPTPGPPGSPQGRDTAPGERATGRPFIRFF